MLNSRTGLPFGSKKLFFSPLKGKEEYYFSVADHHNMEYSTLTLQELADLLSEKTAAYHSLMVGHSHSFTADLNHLALPKGELKDIQAEINKRYAAQNFRQLRKEEMS